MNITIIGILSGILILLILICGKLSKILKETKDGKLTIEIGELSLESDQAQDVVVQNLQRELLAHLPSGSRFYIKEVTGRPSLLLAVLTAIRNH